MLLEYPCAMQRKNHYWRRDAHLYNYVTTVAIAFFIFTSIASAAPTFENSLPLAHSNEIAEYFSEINGCYYNFQRYEEGDRIVTNEPCLNCTCHNRMLMCYLRVCPFTKAIGQDCTIEKKPDQCCPIITCPEVPVKLLTSSTTSPAPITSTTEIGFRDNYGCTINNLFYTDGAQVPSDVNKPCELCYCIRNRTACVMQECTLHVEGCKPIFKPGVCCPVRYECDYDREYTSTARPQTTGGLLKSTTSSPVVDCQYGNKYFSDGELIKTEKPCEHCYCMRGDIVCAVQECGEPLRGKDCIPTTPPPNKCCPSSYACSNETASIEDITKASDIAGTTFVQSDNTFAPYDTTTYRFKNPQTTLSQEEVYERLGEKKTPATTSLPEKIFTTISSLFSKHPSEDIQLPNESVDANEHSSPQPPSEPIKTDAVTEKQDSNEDDKTTPAIVADDVTPGASLPKASQGVIISSTQYEPTTLASIKDIEDNVTKEEFTKSPIDETHDNAVSATEITTEKIKYETTEKIKYETTKISEKYETTKFPERETASEKLTTSEPPAPMVSDGHDDTTEKLVPTEVVTAEKVIDEITTPTFLYSKFPSSSEKQSDESSSESIKFQSTTRQFDKNGGLFKDQETTKAPEESLQATTKVQTDNTEPPALVEQQTENMNTLSQESTASLLENITKIISSVQNSNKIPPYPIPAAETTKTPAISDATTIAKEESAAATEKVTEIASSTTKEEVGTVVPSVIPGEGSCLVDGITYPNTSIIESYNPCHSKCICLSSIPTCTLITCAPPPTNPNCMPIQMKPESCCPVYICNSEKEPSAQLPSSDSHTMLDDPNNNLPHDDETTIVNSYEISTKATEYVKPTTETITEKSKPENEIVEDKPHDEAIETPQNDVVVQKPQEDEHEIENKPQDDIIEHPHSDVGEGEPEHDGGFEPKPTAEIEHEEPKPVENEPVELKPTPEKDHVEDKPELTTVVNDRIQNEPITEGQKVEEVTEVNIKETVPVETAKPEIVTTEKQSSINKIDDDPVTENIAPEEHTTVKSGSIVEEFSTEKDNLANPTTVKVSEEKLPTSSESTTLAAAIGETTEKPAQHDDNTIDQGPVAQNDQTGGHEDEHVTVGSQDISTEIPVTKPSPSSEKYNEVVTDSELPHHDPETTEPEKITTTEGNAIVQPIAVSTENKDEAQNYATEIVPTEPGVTIQFDEKIDVNPTTLPEKIAEINPTTLASEKLEPVPTTLPPKVSDEQGDSGSDNAPSSTQGPVESSPHSENIGTTDDLPIVTDTPSTTIGSYNSSAANDGIETESPNEITTKLYETYSSTQPSGVLTEENENQEPESPATTVKDVLNNELNPSVETTTAAQIINEKITTDGDSTNVPDVTSSNPAHEFTSELYSSAAPTTEKDSESDTVTEKITHSSEQPAAGTYNLQTTTVESEIPVETTEPAIISNEPQQTSASPSYSETTSHYVDSDKHTGSGQIVTQEPIWSEITTIPPTYDEGVKEPEENVKPITILPEINDSPAVTVLPSKTTFPTLPPNYPTESTQTELPIEDHSLNTPSSHDVHEPIQQGGDETTSSHDLHEPIHQTGGDETTQKIESPVTEPVSTSQEPSIPPATKKHPTIESDHTPQYVVETSSEVTQAPIQHSTWTRKPFDEETSEPNYYPPAAMYPTGGDGGIEGPGEETEYEEGSNFGTGTCRYAGKIYVSAQQIPREDPCDFCFCFRSDIICLQQSCPPPIQGCRQETISGFCCPRYECPVASALAYNASTTTTTTTTSTTTTPQPHFTLESSYRGHARKVGCMIHGYFYKVGEDIAIASGPCLECICGSDGRMKCDPKSCSPEPFVRSFMGEALSKR